MKMILIDPETQHPQCVDVTDELHEYYKLLDCDVIDIVTRKIGGKPYTFIVDDEGLLKDHVRITAVDYAGNPMLVGKLLICNMDTDGGNLLPLSHEDIVHIYCHIAFSITPDLEITLAVRDVEPAW